MGLFDRFKKGKKTEEHKEEIKREEVKAESTAVSETSNPQKEMKDTKINESPREEVQSEASITAETVHKEEKQEASQIDEKNGTETDAQQDAKTDIQREQDVQLKEDRQGEKNIEIQSHEESPKEASIPITLERKNEIGPIIFQNEITKEMLQDLTIQEEIFLIISLRHFRERFPQADFEKNEKVLYDELIEKVKNAETLYMTFDKATHFPFINTGYVDLYSKEEYANEAAEYYEKKNYRPLEVKEVKKDTSNQPLGIPIFAWLYHLGMEKLMLDNGKYKMEIKREEILPPPDYTGLPKISVPVMNPSLRYAIINFFEEVKWRVNYPQRKEQVQQKEDKMIEEICKAKYLIPMKQEGKPEKIAEGEGVKKERGTILFAKLVNTEQAAFVPLFTDWTEFQKAYNKKEWNGMIVSIMDAIALAKKDGVVINPLGENLLLNQNSMEAIKKQFPSKVK